MQLPRSLNLMADILERRQKGGTSTQTPGAVAVVTIPHLLGVTPTWVAITPANANARGAPAFYVTLDTTNITLNFVANLTAATSYSWLYGAVAF